MLAPTDGRHAAQAVDAAASLLLLLLLSALICVVIG